MPRHLVLPALLGLLFASLGLAPASAEPPGGAGRYIVVLRDGGTDPQSKADEHRARYGADVSFVYRSALRGYAATIPEARLDDVRRDPSVLFVSDDRPVSISAQSLPTGIDRLEGDNSSQRSGNGSGTVNAPAVAVIDTGSGPHAELNIAGGFNCSTGKSYADGNGHGTHVAGTIGAKDNGTGVVGVVPGVPIYSVRTLNNQGSGSWSGVACGIDWVTRNAAALNIKVASMSLGGGGSDDGNCGNTNNDALHRAICASVAAGVTYVVAAGNDAADFAGSVPASYDEVLTVTAIADYNGRPGGGGAATCRAGVDDTPADFSNFTSAGSADAGHTIAAPGVCILSTWKGGGYNTISGTSMATPHVSGLAALCLSSGQCSGTPAQVSAKLRADAAAQPAAYGYVANPARYDGPLAYAGGY